MKVIYSQRALGQLIGTYEYLVLRNEKAAAAVSANLATTIARLQHLPHLGKLTDEADVRVLIEPEYLYRVFYRLEDKCVVVLSILHPSQA